MTANNILTQRKILHMKKTDNQLFAEYEAAFISKVQDLSAHRAQKFTQSEAARRCGVSLRKIQHFENYRCLDAYLLFAYERIMESKSCIS